MINQLRYMFEHMILPSGFFGTKATFIATFMSNEKNLFLLFDNLLKENRIDNPFTENDFKVQPGRISERIFFLKLIFPEPEVTPGCYFSYCFFDPTFEHLAFFTIEKSESVPPELKEIFKNAEFGDDSIPYVCGWDAHRNHLNYGKHRFDEDDLLFFCANLYSKMIMPEVISTPSKLVSNTTNNKNIKPLSKEDFKKDNIKKESEGGRWNVRKDESGNN